MARLTISDLLNPETSRAQTPPPPPLGLVDARRQWDEIQALSEPTNPIFVSPRTSQGLARALALLRAGLQPTIPPSTSISSPLTHTPQSPLEVLPSSPKSSPSLPSVRYDVVLNRKTTLRRLFTHPRDTALEYPETVNGGSVGHLFEVSPANWISPTTSFAYSLGAPSGRTTIGDSLLCPLLVDSFGTQVPCVERHYTCTNTNKI